MKKLFVLVEAFAFAAVTVGAITINPPTMQMMVAASQTANSPQARAVEKIIAFVRAAGTLWSC